MRNFLLGTLAGAVIAGGIFYYLRIKEEDDQKEELKSLIESMKLERARNQQASSMINDPHSGISNGLTVLVGLTDEFYYYRDNDCSRIGKATLQQINEILKQEKATRKNDDLMIIIKQLEQSTYKNSVDLLDAITMAGIPAGHFALVDLSEREKICLQQYKKN